MKDLAPVILFVYNRPFHTLQTLDFLSQNELADQSTLYIYSDGPKSNMSENGLAQLTEVRRLIKSKKWCKEVIIIESDKNNGLARSIIDGVSTVIKKHGKAIVLEDDMVTSKWFLSYMNQALNKYEKNEKVMHINAYMPQINDALPDFFFTQLMQCWGWATWKHAWEHFEENTESLYNTLKKKNQLQEFDGNTYNFFIKQLKDNLTGKKDTWAIKWYASIFLNGGYCLSPNNSFIQNIGTDGSGENCQVDTMFDTSLYDTRPEINLTAETGIDDAANSSIYAFYKKGNSLYAKINRKLKSYLGIKDKKATIFIGPLPPPVTGLSVSMEYVYKNFNDEKYLIDINYTNKSKLSKGFILIKAVMKLLLLLIIKPRIKQAYITLALSKAGLIRDILFINMLSLFNVKITNHSYGSGVNSLFNSLSPRLYKAAFSAYSKIDTTIVLIEDMCEEFDRFNNMKLKVIPLYYDAILDKYERKEKETDIIYLSFYSNLLYSKGIIYALEAFQELSKRYNNLRLNIAGLPMADNFKSKEEIEALFNKYKKDNANIKYYGIIKGEKKLDFLTNSDILLFPSFYEKEGFPISIIESMRCGNAVIITKHNYIHKIITDEGGLVIQKQNKDEIIGAVEFYLNDRKVLKEHQQFNTLKAIQSFQLNNFIKSVHTVINQ